MKKNKILVRVIPTVCLAILLLSTIVHTNKHSGIQQKTTLDAQTVGEVNKEDLSQPAYNTDNQMVNLTAEKEQYQLTKKSDGGQQAGLKQDQVNGKTENNPRKDTSTGIGSIPVSNVSSGPSLEWYDPANITTVTNVNELESNHNYSNNQDHMWVYRNPDAPVLRITFSYDTFVQRDADFIYLYDMDNVCLGTYTADELSGKTITLWGDTIKIRLCSDNSNSFYGFKVTNVITLQDYVEYKLVYEELPTYWYTGDSNQQTLKLVKRYIEGGVAKTKEVTENVRFVWKSYSSSGEGIMDGKIEGNKLTVIAKKIGTIYGYIEAYEGSSTKPVAETKRYHFQVAQLIVNNDVLSNNTIKVNEIQKKSLNNIYIRDVKEGVIVNNVVSSAPTIISIVKNATMGGCSFTVQGNSPGKAEITVYYTVRDGEKVISASSTYYYTCMEPQYLCQVKQSGSKLLELCPTQTSEITFDLTKDYYDKNNIYHPNELVDPSKYTIEIIPEDINKRILETSIKENKIIVKALYTGSGMLKCVIKIEGKVVYQVPLSFSIATQQYVLEYDGPTKLYPNQIVKGPSLIFYEYYRGQLEKTVKDKAVITCGKNSAFTYQDGNIVAGNETSNSENCVFTCNYNSTTYTWGDNFVVSKPKLTSSGNMYIGEKVKMSLDFFPVIDNTCSLTWSVVNYDYWSSKEKYASIEMNSDGTAMLSCLNEGRVTVAATFKRGEEIIWTRQNTYTIEKGISGILGVTNKSISLNQRASIDAYDFRKNNTYYNTIITSIKSSDPSIVEVVNYTKTKYSDHNCFCINVTGNKVGKADVIINYIYFDEEGTLIQGAETVNMEVSGPSYSFWWENSRDTAVAGESIPLSFKVYRTGYDINGTSYSKLVDSSEVKVNYDIENSPIATLNNGILTFKKEVSTGNRVNLTPSITVDGKTYASYARRITIVSNYYKIQGVSDSNIYINEDEKKTLDLELYLFDKDNLIGKPVEGVTFLWNNKSQSEANNETLTNSYFSTNGRSITGIKRGTEQVTLVASYKDENDTTKYVTKSITIQVLPKVIPVLELGQKEGISQPNKYFSVTPKKTETYKITCSDDNTEPLIELYDQNWKKIVSYEKLDSENAEFFFAHVRLEAGKTYYVRASSTSTSSIWPSYTMLIESDMVSKEINRCNIQLSAQQFIYNGKEQKPIITIKDGYYTLKEDTDYLIYESGDMASAGSYTLSIQGIGKYLGSVKKTCVIQPCKLTDVMVQPYEFQVVFNEQVQKPELILMNGKNALTKGTDYDVNYKGDFTAKGTHTMTIYGSDNYTGVLTKSLDIKDKLDITLCSAKLSKDSISYMGKEEKPTVMIMNGSYTLQPVDDYKIEYVGDFKSSGTHLIKIIGTGVYAGTITKQFTITKASQTLAFVKSAILKKYQDKPFINALTLSSVKTVTYTSSNTKVAKVDAKGMVTIVGGGKATITAVYVGNQNYNGMKATYTLMVAKNNNSITAGNVVKTASSKVQTFTLKVIRKGNATLSYTSNNKAVTVKAGKVTIAKNFVGTAVITITAASNTNYNAISKKITITVNPAGTKVASLKSQSKNKFLLKWSSNKLVSGYEIQYASNKSFSKATKKAITKSSTTSYQASKLKKKTTYYVRIRTYKIVNRVKYYSGWSTVKYIRMK